MGLQLALRGSADVTILDASGRATIGEGSDQLAAELRRLIDGGARKILVNLSGMTHIDSTGISALVRAYISHGRNGGHLKLLVGPGRVQETLSATRLLGAIPAFDNEADALASFRTLPPRGAPTETSFY